MLEKVPTFLNSALQGFLPSVLDRVHERQSINSNADLQCTDETEPYHVNFVRTLLRQR